MKAWRVWQWCGSVLLAVALIVAIRGVVRFGRIGGYPPSIPAHHDASWVLRQQWFRVSVACAVAAVTLQIVGHVVSRALPHRRASWVVFAVLAVAYAVTVYLAAFVFRFDPYAVS